MKLIYLVTGVATFTSVKMVAARAVLPKDNDATPAVNMELASPVLVEQVTPTCTRAVCIPVDEGVAPTDGMFPVAVEGSSPVSKAQTAVPIDDEKHPRDTLKVPARGDEAIPVIASSTAPVGPEGTSPVSAERAEPITTKDVSTALVGAIDYGDNSNATIWKRNCPGYAWGTRCPLYFFCCESSNICMRCGLRCGIDPAPQPFSCVGPIPNE